MRLHACDAAIAAVGLFLGACSSHPRDAESQFTWTVRAAALYENTDYEPACQLLERVAKGAETAQTWTNVGVVRAAQGRTDAARGAWRRAIALDQNDPRPRFLMARVDASRATALLAQRDRGGQGDEATALLTAARQNVLEALEAAPNDVALHALLASIESSRGDSAAANAATRQALRLAHGGGCQEAGELAFGSIRPPALRQVPGSARTAPRLRASSLGVQAAAARVADPNGDGRLDLLLDGVAGWLRNESTAGAERVRWSSHHLADSPVAGIRAVPLGDQARDDLLWWTGQADDGTQQVSWSAGSGDSLHSLPLEVVGEAWNDVAVADVDQDGDLDLIIATNGVPGLRLWKRVGVASFDTGILVDAFETLGPIRSVTTADLNRDGHADLLAIDNRERVWAFVGCDSGWFAELDAFPEPEFHGARALAVTDLDADGQVDVVLGTDQGLWVYTNVGQGRFRRRANFRPTHIGWSARVARGVAITGLHTVDMDNDGFMDIVALHEPATQRVAALKGRASEDTAPPSQFAYVTFWHNDGDGVLRDLSEQAGLDQTSLARSTLDSGDLDGDGDCDVVYVGTDNTVHVLWNRCPETLRRLHIELQRNGRRAVPHGAHVSVFSGTTVRHTTLDGLDASIGIAELQQADIVRVVWPDGAVQNQLDVAWGSGAVARIRFER